MGGKNMKSKGSFQMTYVIWALVIAVGLVVGAIVGYFALGVPRINELTSENTDLQEQIQTVEGELQTTQTSFEEAQADIDDLNSELDDAQEELSDLQTSVDDYQDEIEDLNSMYDELQDEYDDLQEDYDNVTETIDEIEEDLDNMTERYEKVSDDLDYLEDLLYDNDATYAEGWIGDLYYELECPYLVEEDEKIEVTIRFEALGAIDWVDGTDGELELRFLLNGDEEKDKTVDTGTAWADGYDEDVDFSFTPDVEGEIHLEIYAKYWYDSSECVFQVQIPIAQSVDY